MPHFSRHYLVRRVGSVVGTLCLLALVSACSRPAPPEEPVRAVKVLEVQVGTLDAGREFPGEVRARVESTLGFRVGGKIIRRQAEVGQRVKAGQVLAQLDPQDLRLAADAARAQVNAAATNRDLAAADYQRYRGLKEQNFISGAELERRDATRKAAQAQLEQAQAQLAAQGNQVAYASLVADVSGVVTAVQAEPGQVVSAGTPVFRIAQDGPRDVVFAVPEDRVSALSAGSPVGVRQWSSDVHYDGTIREVGASADAVTRTFTVKVALQGDAPALGTTVYVVPQALGHAGTAAIKLPTSALRMENHQSAVWLLDRASMTLTSQPVQVGTADGNEAVIAAGLQPGMLVVVAGVHVLSQGQKVTIYQEKVASGQDIRRHVATNSVAVAPAGAASTPSAAPVAPVAPVAPARK